MAGGLAVAGYQSAFVDTTTAAEASATASATSTGSACMTLMTSVTEGPYHLDGALVRKDITEGKAGVPLTLRLTVVDATDGCTPVSGAAVEIWHCDAWGYSAGATEAQARLDALPTVMSTLQDTELLYTAGPLGLRHVMTGARAVLDAGGTATAAGRQALSVLDGDLHARAWSPRGSAGLLTGALFLDVLPVAARVRPV